MLIARKPNMYDSLKILNQYNGLMRDLHKFLRCKNLLNTDEYIKSMFLTVGGLYLVQTSIGEICVEVNEFEAFVNNGCKL